MPTATPSSDIDLDHGPTFLKSIAWMMLTLSLLTVGVGGLFWKADQSRPASFAAGTLR